MKSSLRQTITIIIPQAIKENESEFSEIHKAIINKVETGGFSPPSPPCYRSHLFFTVNKIKQSNKRKREKFFDASKKIKSKHMRLPSAFLPPVHPIHKQMIADLNEDVAKHKNSINEDEVLDFVNQESLFCNKM